MRQPEDSPAGTGRERGAADPAQAGAGRSARSQKVYLVGGDGKPKAVPVTTGISDSGFVELVGGDAEGERRGDGGADVPGEEAGGMGSPMGPRF